MKDPAGDRHEPEPRREVHIARMLEQVHRTGGCEGEEEHDDYPVATIKARRRHGFS